MAKVSITNIRPPSTPPATTWNLNDSTTNLDFFAWNVLNDGDNTTNDNSAFDAKVALVNFGGFDTGLVDQYDYIFFGVNGGSDEIVTGVADKSGIIVTGNGKDTINGGSHDDLVFAGNGTDTVHGGGGDDVIFGENGADQLYGDAGNDQIDGGNGDDYMAGGDGADDLYGGADNDTLHGQNGNDQLHGEDGNDLLVGGADEGTATWTQSGGNVLKDGIVWLNPVPTDGSIASGNGDFQAIRYHGDIIGYEYNDPTAFLTRAGAYLDGDSHVNEVFSFDPKDMPTYDVLNAVTVTAAVFNGANQFVTTIGTWTLNENQKVYFSVDLEQYAPNGGQVVMFSGSTVGTFTDNIKVHGLDSLSQYYDQLGAGQWEFAFGTAGDILTGGAGTDTFQYASGDGVDVIQDFHRTDGDVLKLVSISADDVEIINDSADSYVVFKDALAASGHLDDAAIKIVGVNDFSISDITFAV